MVLDVIYSGKIGEPGLLDPEMVNICKLFYVLKEVFKGEFEV